MAQLASMRQRSTHPYTQSSQILEQFTLNPRTWIHTLRNSQIISQQRILRTQPEKHNTFPHHLFALHQHFLVQCDSLH